MDDLKLKYEESIQNGQPFILTLDDLKLKIDDSDKKIESIEDLILVHKTDFYQEDAIKTPYDTKKSDKIEFIIHFNNEKHVYEIPIRDYRNTVHFCLNGGVESHIYGSWDEKKYAIFLPLASNKDKIVAGRECDLFSEGSVPLNETAYILCPKDEMAKMKESNPTSHIVGYEGKTVSPYVSIFIQLLGYKYKKPTQNSRVWDSGYSNDHKVAEDIIIENDWQLISHYGSKWYWDELMQQNADILIEELNIIKNENILYNEENIESVRGPIITFFDSEDLMFKDPEIFSAISSRIKQETGIDIEKFTNYESFSKVTFSNQKIFLKDLASNIVKQMRLNCLYEKEKTNSLNEKEKIQLQYIKEYGDWQKGLEDTLFTNNVLESLKVYESSLNKSYAELSEEERQKVLDVINFKLQLHKNLRDKQERFELRFMEAVPKEEAEEIGKYTGMYSKERNEGLYLTYEFPNQREILSNLSGVNIEEVYKKMGNVDFHDLYELDKIIHTLPNCHIYDNLESWVITDCKITELMTIEEITHIVERYAQLLTRYYSGEKIEFDELGNVKENIDDISKADISNLSKEEMMKLKETLQLVQSENIDIEQDGGLGR